MNKKIILFELNEVPFRVLDHFCTSNPRSSFAQSLPYCSQYETLCADEPPLSPWRTWPTLHRGVSEDRHGIHDFGQDLEKADRVYPPIWKILAAHRVSTGVCGSLHSYPLPATPEGYSFYLPDTFAPAPDCLPQSLSFFQEFNLNMSRESARNVSRSLPMGAALRILMNARSVGLRSQTFASIGSQLVAEVFQSWRKTRRRTYQSVLAFDVFAKIMQDTQPDFATFFTNHVAASMHRYWAAAFPEDFETNLYDDQWIKTYRGEIDFAMGKADQFFGRLVEFVDRHPGYVLWVTTSMGQASWLAVPLETQLYIKDLEQFMNFMEVPAAEWSRRPAMLPEVNVVVSPGSAGRFAESVAQLRIEGEQLEVNRNAEGLFVLKLGQKNLHKTPQIAVFGGREVPFEKLGFSCEKIEDQADSTGYHIKSGVFLTYDPANRASKSSLREQLSTLEIAPAILRNYSVPVPEYMKTGEWLTNQ